MSRLLLITASLVLVACQPGNETVAGKRDYLLTGAKPNRLFLIDAEKREVVKEHRIADAGAVVATIVPSPSGEVAYALVNNMESIVGIDLDSGEQIFRADLSSPGLRVKCLFAFDVTPDGEELIVYEMPVRLHPAEYEVLEPRFSVYRTDAGLAAEPVRQFPAPRRIHLLLSKASGESFYALGFDLYEHDRQSGELLATQGVRNWNQPNRSVPDILSFWPVSEATGVWATPAYSVLTDMDPEDPAAYKTGLLTVDRGTGSLEYHDFENTSAIIFSTVLSPVRPEAYGVYTQLSKIDTQSFSLSERIELPHTYYAINIASDGSEVYLGGTMCDIGVHDTETLDRKAVIELPGCPDQGVATLRVIQR